MFKRIKQFWNNLILAAPMVCFCLVIYAAYLGIRVVNCRQDILSLSREISFVEKNCENLVNKNIELKSQILAMKSTHNVLENQSYAFEEPNIQQVFKASKSDIASLYHNGAEKHFAIKQQTTASKLAFVKNED